MGSTTKLNRTLKKFIERQPLFFVATADKTGRVNVSPKGMDTLKIKSDTRIVWLNLSGSGNETAAHIRATKRMTLMFCAFEGNPMILRLYGQAKVYHPYDSQWTDLIVDYPMNVANRQIFDLNINFVQTSCGSGVPIMEFKKSRAEEELLPFYERMGNDGIKEYWQKKNMTSIDGKPTGIFGDS